MSELRPRSFKPVVELHAFMQGPRMHVAAVLENTFTYEVYSLGIVGQERIMKFGKRNGLKAIMYALRAVGLDLLSEVAQEVLEAVRAL